MKLARLPLVLPALAFVGLVAIVPSANQQVDLQTGSVSDFGVGTVPLPQDVAAVRLGQDCVKPSSDMDWRYLQTLIISDADGSGVRTVPFDDGLAASRDHDAQVILSCA